MRTYWTEHKIKSSIAILLVLLVGYWGYGKLTSKAGDPQYVVTNVQTGTLVTTITGTGQVSSSNQIELKPKASGDVVYVGVTSGQVVRAGTTIVSLDATDAQKAVRDAEVNVQSAQISLQKIKQPADTLSTIQAQNALASAQTSLAKAYDDGWNSVSQTFIDLPGEMAGMQSILYGTDVSKGSQDNISAYNDMIYNIDQNVTTFRDNTATKYKTAVDVYNKNFNDFRMSSRTMGTTSIDSLIQETYATTQLISDSIKSTNDFLNYIRTTLTTQNKQIPASLTSAQASLNTYTNQINSHLTDLLNVKNTLTSSAFSIAEKTASLSKLQSGSDPLDIQSAELNLVQRQNALKDAQTNLSNYYVTAPFDGTVAAVNVKKYDSVSSGTAVATLITSQQFAEISLNEVDVSKVKLGQKATLTFDAIDGLTITGVVSEIDSVGTVSQGVVTYNVKISLDTQDDRIKPGMSVSATIITNTVQDALLVPSTAVKTQGNISYVEIFTPPLSTTTPIATGNQGIATAVLPQQVIVEVGLSDDTSTQIISGLTDGEQVVVRTIAPTGVKTSTTPSLLNAVGGNRAGGSTGGATTRTLRAN